MGSPDLSSTGRVSSPAEHLWRPSPPRQGPALLTVFCGENKKHFLVIVSSSRRRSFADEAAGLGFAAATRACCDKQAEHYLAESRHDQLKSRFWTFCSVREHFFFSPDDRAGSTCSVTAAAHFQCAETFFFPVVWAARRFLRNLRERTAKRGCY